MNKKYQIKAYNLDNQLVVSVSPHIVMSDISYSWAINAGMGALKLKINTLFDSYEQDQPWIRFGYYVKVYCYDKNNQGTPIYQGYILNINPTLDERGEFVEVECIGLSGLLSDILFGAAPSFVQEVGKDPSLVIKDAIDLFSIKYPNTITYDPLSIESYGASFAYLFEQDSCLDVIKKIIENTQDYYWIIDREGVFRFKSKSSQPDHIFDKGKHVIKVRGQITSKDLVNKIWVEYSNNDVVSGEDALSVLEFREKQKYIKDGNIKSLSTANARLLSELEKAKPENSIIIEINNQYNIESINVGDTIKVRGFKHDNPLIQDNMQIMSLQYSPDKITLTLNKKRDIIKKLKIEE